MTDTKIPSLGTFIMRLLVMVGVGASISTFSLLNFYKLAVQVTPADQKVMSSYGVPISIVGIVIYLGIIFNIARPLGRYIVAVRRGERLDESYVLDIQYKALDLGYKMAILASLFYLITNPSIFIISIHNLHWDFSEMIWYGLAGGVICGLMMIPLGFNFGSWVVRPLVEHTASIAREYPSRRGGRKIGLGFKMLVTFIPIIVSLLIFSSFMGYSQANSMYGNFREIEKKMLDKSEVAMLVDKVEHLSDPGMRSSRYYEKHMENLKLYYTTFLLIGIGLTLIFTILASADITRPLRTLTRSSERIKQGHYEEWVRLATNDEMGDMGESFNRMKQTVVRQMESMGRLLEQLREGIRQMDESVGRVLKVCSEQSSGATQQSSAATEASAVADQFLTTAGSIAEKAGAVKESSTSTLEACEKGESTLKAAHLKLDDIAVQSRSIVETTEELREMFERVFDIVRVIEDIADRTELLSLNAMIEAVGAGDYGRRFMIVAEETRKLAKYTNGTVKDIRNLVEKIQVRTLQAAERAGAGASMVDEERRVVDDVVKALGIISGLAASTSNMVAEITYTANQQGSVSGQLSHSIKEVKDVAALVAEGAKQIEDTVTDLKQFSQSLGEIVKSTE